MYEIKYDIEKDGSCGSGIHTSLRKYCDTKMSVILWNIIEMLPEHNEINRWALFVQFMDNVIRDHTYENVEDFYKIIHREIQEYGDCRFNRKLAHQDVELPYFPEDPTVSIFYAALAIIDEVTVECMIYWMWDNFADKTKD